MGASHANYGIATSRFFWIGAIPAMVFVGIFMMPFYYGSRAESVPQYLKLRFDEKTRGFNAISFAVMTVFSSGISMYAMAKIVQSLHLFDAAFNSADPGLDLSQLLSHLVVDCARVHFPRRAHERNLQRSAAILSDRGRLLAPRVAWTKKRRRTARPRTESTRRLHALLAGHEQSAQDNAMGIEWFGLAMGLGFVLSFGYWCTDFLVVHPAMAAESMSAARRTPLHRCHPENVLPILSHSTRRHRRDAAPNTVPLPNPPNTTNTAESTEIARRRHHPTKG